MRKTIVILLILTSISSVVFGQAVAGGDDFALTAQQSLKEISVSKMEDAGFWYSLFSSDNGNVVMRTFAGGAGDKEAINDEEQLGLGEADEKVVGAKTSFYRRGVMDITLKPIRSLPIEGITKTISVWVAGRNTQHRLEILLSDHLGNKTILPMGKLNFSGWKKLTVTIPPHIKQMDYHYSNNMGLVIDGFNIKCNIDETYGTYYIYLDDIRAVTDLFPEESRDINDMSDAW